MRKLYIALIVSNLGLLNSCSSEDSRISQIASKSTETNLSTLSLGVNESDDLWANAEGDSDFRNQMETQIKEVISYGFKNPLTFSLRLKDLDSESPLVFLKKISLNRSNSGSEVKERNVIFAHGGFNTSFTNYDADFSFVLKTADNEKELVNFPLYNFLHLFGKYEITAETGFPDSIISAMDIALPSFFRGFITKINPTIKSGRISQDHIPQELKKAGEVGVFQKAFFTKVMYPLCCTLSRAECPELEKVHPLLHKRKASLLELGHSYDGLTQTNLSCEPSEFYEDAIESTMLEIESSKKFAALYEALDIPTDEVEVDLLKLFDDLWFGTPQ